MQARWRGTQRGTQTGVAACGDCGVHEPDVVGSSLQVSDVLLGEDDGESGRHGWTSFGCGSVTLIRTSCSCLAVR
jgi:hypothetical protein